MSIETEQCAACRTLGRPVIRCRSFGPRDDIGWVTRLLCRYCWDRIKAHPTAHVVRRWPGLLVMPCTAASRGGRYP